MVAVNYGKRLTSPQSASYSSTAGALLTPTSSSYPSAGASDGSAETHSAASPGITNVPSSGSMYGSSLSSARYSPRSSGQPQRPIPASTGPPTDLRLHVPPMSASGYSYPATYSYQQQPMSAHPQSAQPYTPQPMTAPVGRTTGSWDFAGLMDPSPATANPTGMPAMDYERVPSTLATSQSYLAGASSYGYGMQSSGV